MVSGEKNPHVGIGGPNQNVSRLLSQLPPWSMEPNHAAEFSIEQWQNTGFRQIFARGQSKRELGYSHTNS